MRKSLKLSLMGLCLGVSVLAADQPPQEEVDLYHELLSHDSETHLAEILAEGAKRDLPLPSDLKSLWAKPQLRSLILESVDLKKAEELKLFSATEFLKLSSTEQSVLLLRFNNEEAWRASQKARALGLEVYPELPSWARALIVSQHETLDSKELVPLIQKLDQKSDVELCYLLKYKKSSAEDLKYTNSDSKMLSATKLSLLSGLSSEEKLDVLESYKGCRDAIKTYVIPHYGEKTLLELLKKNKNQEQRAVALKSLLSKKWMEGQVTRVLKSKSWSEAQVVFAYLCDNPDKITAASFDKYWKLSHDLGKTVLSAFLWQHPKKEVSKTLVQHLEQSEKKEIALKAMHALPAHGNSEWLKQHVAAKKWSDELRAMALDTLWEWKEVPNDEFYVRIFLDQGYRNGGPGMESLLKLMALSKDRKAPKIIASFFREVEEPVVEVEVAIEAAGWHGSKDFLGALKKMERDGNDDPLLLWALKRCRGEEAPFPEQEKGNYSRVNPYFFNSTQSDG